MAAGLLMALVLASGVAYVSAKFASRLWQGDGKPQKEKVSDGGDLSGHEKKLEKHESFVPKRPQIVKPLTEEEKKAAREKIVEIRAEVEWERRKEEMAERARLEKKKAQDEEAARSEEKRRSREKDIARKRDAARIDREKEGASNGKGKPTSKYLLPKNVVMEKDGGGVVEFKRIPGTTSSWTGCDVHSMEGAAKGGLVECIKAFNRMDSSGR